MYINIIRALYRLRKDVDIGHATPYIVHTTATEYADDQEPYPLCRVLLDILREHNPKQIIIHKYSSSNNKMLPFTLVYPHNMNSIINRHVF